MWALQPPTQHAASRMWKDAKGLAKEESSMACSLEVDLCLHLRLGFRVPKKPSTNLLLEQALPLSKRLKFAKA